MLAKGWKKERLASKAEVDVRTIPRPDQYRELLTSSLEGIARALGVPVEEIVVTDWVIDKYEIYAKVWPLSPPETRQATVGYEETKTMSVVTNNAAHIKKTVEFSDDGNKDPFRLQYRTRGGGLVHLRDGSRIRDPLRNLFLKGPVHEKTIYGDYGNDVTYSFQPSYPSTEALDLEVYNGFDAGNQNLTCYIPGPAIYKHIKAKLDLSKYVDNGFDPSAHLVFFAEDDHPGAFQAPWRHASEAPSIAPFDQGYGSWIWNLDKPRPGVVYLWWDLAT
jgi:hypothetical protein